jgi:hypothetical protein
MPRRPPCCGQDAGQGLVEYAIILALTSFCIVLALLALRSSIASPVRDTSNRIEAAGLDHGQPGTGEPAGAGGGVAGQPARPAQAEPR